MNFEDPGDIFNFYFTVADKFGAKLVLHRKINNWSNNSLSSEERSSENSVTQWNMYFMGNMQVFVVFSAHDYEIHRDRIILLEILGNGQFGDVHKGVYREKVSF